MRLELTHALTHMHILTNIQLSELKQRKGQGHIIGQPINATCICDSHGTATHPKNKKGALLFSLLRVFTYSSSGPDECKCCGC